MLIALRWAIAVLGVIGLSALTFPDFFAPYGAFVTATSFGGVLVLLLVPWISGDAADAAIAVPAATVASPAEEVSIPAAAPPAPTGAARPAADGSSMSTAAVVMAMGLWLVALVLPAIGHASQRPIRGITAFILGPFGAAAVGNDVEAAHLFYAWLANVPGLAALLLLAWRQWTGAALGGALALMLGLIPVLEPNSLRHGYLVWLASFGVVTVAGVAGGLRNDTRQR